MATSNLIFPLSLLILVLFMSLISITSLTRDSESSILLSVKKQLGDPKNLSTWRPNTSPCSWYGVQCSTNKVVTGILIPGADIITQIPISICLLPNLTILDLSWNYIPGPFPIVLYNCSSLTHLNLYRNNMVGPIPYDIYKLSSIQYLDLGNNNFSGNVPKSIGLLTQLTTLSLALNYLDGTFPIEIGNLSKLEKLEMSWNPFTPTNLPSGLGKLKNLQYLYMTDCNLVGEIPDSIGELESLQHLDLSENQLTGRIPNSLFMIRGLSYLYAYQNNLTGPIPSQIQALNMIEIDLSGNNLSGSIPEQVGNLTRLQVLNLYNNNLTGIIPVGVGNLPELATIKLFLNNISGTLPVQLGLHSPLFVLEIGRNSISGPIPENLCSKGAFVGLTAFSNKLSGKIPRSLENCNLLRTLMIPNNSLTGEIPLGIWTLPNLVSLIFSGNNFTGQLPRDVAPNITHIQLDNNKFMGVMPSLTSSWRNLVVLEADNNLLFGGLPSGLTSLSKLNKLSLRGNKLSGKLPVDIGSWNNMDKIDLSRNQLTGPLPTAFASLPSLKVLDLSENFLSGNVPPQFQKTSFNFLNLSHNDLQGPLPSIFDDWSFANSFLSTRLCTPRESKILKLPTCPASSTSYKHQSAKYLVVVIVAIFILFSISLPCTVYITRRHRDDEEVLWTMTYFERLEFTESSIVSRLVEGNVIGSGGSGKVYKVQLDHLGLTVAVKQLWSSQSINNAQFMTEVHILGRIRNINVVKLLCCITSDSSKLIVYEYLENRSLDRWLHNRRLESEGGQALHVLDWPTRMKIAIGAARGLCYMHHDCSRPIIHRDVKSSNILLDCEFNAKIADFGVAKMMTTEGELRTMSTVGSLGYMAPEYGYTRRLNEKIDVYSFGVVLLELATGKEAHNREETMNLADWSWKHCIEEKPIEDALDAEIVQDNFVPEMSKVFKMGLICTHRLPTSRPSMKDVLLELVALHRGEADRQLQEQDHERESQEQDHERVSMASFWTSLIFTGFLFFYFLVL